HVDVAGTLEDELPVLLGQASPDGDLEVGPAPLQRLQVAEVPVELVVGVLPDAAGVEHDEVGLVGGADRLHPLLREQPGEALRVVLVHLAPEGPDPEALPGHRIILRTARPTPALDALGLASGAVTDGTGTGANLPDGVSMTALGVAWVRAGESERPDRLFDDPLAARGLARREPLLRTRPAGGARLQGAGPGRQRLRPGLRAHPRPRRPAPGLDDPAPHRRLQARRTDRLDRRGPAHLLHRGRERPPPQR